MQHATREEIREADRIAIEDYAMPGVILMENAGRGAADVAMQMLESEDTSRCVSHECSGRGNRGFPPRDAPHCGSAPAAAKNGDWHQRSEAETCLSPFSALHVAIVCGRGNNGGDGFVVARHLHNRGVAVTVHLLAPRDKIGGDALINLRIAEKMKLDIRDAAADELNLAESSLIIDAMLGTGLSGEVREPFRAAIRAINAAGKPVLAIDIPSGLDANTGEILGNCVRATRTATFALPKIGFTRKSGPATCGDVTIVDIGVPREILE